MAEVPEKELSAKKQRKVAFGERLRKYMDEYKSILIIGVDNVGSNMLQQVRMALRGEAVILMGKNTMMRKIVRGKAEEDPKFAPLLDTLNGNVGFLFTNGDLGEIRKRVQEFKVPAAAKSGAFAPVDVWIPKGPTALDPGQTNFFQALNIATKIAKGSIEIVTDVHIITKGERITSSGAVLLAKLGVKPFFFGIIVTQVFEDGCVFSADVLDLRPEDLLAKFWTGVNMVASVSLAIGYPTLASIPHSFANAFKKLVAIAVETEYSFPEAQIFKDYLADPSAFASAAPAAAAGGAAPAAAAPEPEPEEEEEEEDMGFSLFD
jgi:large subunit ribosomal protein LP0